jgi:two-component system, chemotaxis family, chemotaxis protein CheV
MSTWMQEVDARTRLAGANTMELLLFDLGEKEIYGINVFKIREVMQMPELTRMPDADFRIEGVANIRGHMVPVINLRRALKLDEIASDRSGNVVISEYNKNLQGLHVMGVDRIIRLGWDQIKAPPQLVNAKNGGSVTAVTVLDDSRMVLILDVEKVLSDICPRNEEEFDSKISQEPRMSGKRILFADDSIVARKQIINTLSRMGVNYVQAVTGKDAWENLQSIADKASASGRKVLDEIQLILTDIEMPEMDGFTLTKKVREDLRFHDIPIIMHSSLTGTCNEEKGKSVGATDYVTKFDPKVLADKLIKYIG